MSQPDLSRIRNAVRDTAESMQRFESNFERMQREMRRALEEGVPQAEVTATANEALRGHPDLQHRVREMIGRLEAKQSSSA